MYLSGNIVFIPIDRKDRNSPSTKYMVASISGYIFSSDIYTEKEIIDKYPDAQKLNSFLEINKVYHKTH